MFQDEVLAISEKVVIRLEDLVTWMTVETQWSWGRLAKCEDDLTEVTVEADQLACPRRPAGNSFSLSETVMDFADVEQEREKFGKLQNFYKLYLGHKKITKHHVFYRQF